MVSVAFVIAAMCAEDGFKKKRWLGCFGGGGVDLDDAKVGRGRLADFR